jgi:hypothetical protein
MDVTNQLQEILKAINRELDPNDRVSEQEIGAAGWELNRMLNVAAQTAAGQLPTPGRPRTLRQKLAALWAAIRDKITAWLSPVPPRWLRFVNALKAKLQQLQNTQGNEAMLGLGLMAVAIALVAALLKSMPLLVGLLAALGFVSLVRLIERVTRIPAFI